MKSLCLFFFGLISVVAFSQQKQSLSCTLQDTWYPNDYPKMKIEAKNYYLSWNTSVAKHILADVTILLEKAPLSNSFTKITTLTTWEAPYNRRHKDLSFFEGVKIKNGQYIKNFTLFDRALTNGVPFVEVKLLQVINSSGTNKNFKGTCNIEYKPSND